MVRWLRRACRTLGWAVAACLAVVVLVNLLVTRSITGLGYESPAEVPTRPVALVFGAAAWGGQPSSALADRLDGAAALYRLGRVSHVLVSGDNAQAHYDEPTVMRDYLLTAGVPGSAITRDDAGLSTYESCYRARDVFGVRDAVLVTQDYHLSRALYTCRELGIDAVGLRIPDWQHHPERLTRGQYPTDMAATYMTREWLARMKSVVEVKVTQPPPTFLGPFVGLIET